MSVVRLIIYIFFFLIEKEKWEDVPVRILEIITDPGSMLGPEVNYFIFFCAGEEK